MISDNNFNEGGSVFNFVDNGDVESVLTSPETETTYVNSSGRKGYDMDDIHYKPSSFDVLIIDTSSKESLELYKELKSNIYTNEYAKYQILTEERKFYDDDGKWYIYIEYLTLSYNFEKLEKTKI